MNSFLIVLIVVVVACVIYLGIGFGLGVILNKSGMGAVDSSFKGLMAFALKWPKLFIKIGLAVLFLASTSHAYTVTLQWDANTDTDLAGYKMHYANANSQPFNGTGSTLGVSGAVTIPKGTQIGSLSGLDPAKPYFFAITAYNISGQESAYSNIVTVPIIPRISNFKSVTMQNTIILSWNAMAGITEYQVYDAKTDTIIQRVVAPALTARITGIPGGRAFYVTGSGPALFAVASTTITIPTAVTGMKATVIIP